MDIEFGATHELVTEDVVATHLGGSLGAPTTFGNGTRNPEVDICNSREMPDIASYLSGINIYGIILFSCGAVAVLIILLIYLDTLWYVMKNISSRIKTHNAFVISVYPVVGIATYCAMVVPRAHLLAEAVAQGMFMFALYQLFCMFVAYCGGEAELIRRLKANSLDPMVAPCCCWPCCILPLLSVNKRNIRLLRILVFQLPIVQGLVYMILLVMWAEEQSIYQVNYMYLQPFVVASILLGIWGMAMTIKMLRCILGDYSLPSKFFALQLVLLASKLQGLIERSLVWSGVWPCKPPINPVVYSCLLYNSAMLVEMVLLGLWARNLYKRPLPEADGHSREVQQVCSIATVCPTTEGSSIKDGSRPVTPKTNNNQFMFDNKNFVDVKL